MFHEVATQVHARWRQQGRRCEAFAPVSAEVLLAQAGLVERNEVLFWADNGVHQHELLGALCAIAGQRIHDQILASAYPNSDAARLAAPW